MSNLEDVFLKINQTYAPDLFADLVQDKKALFRDSALSDNNSYRPSGIGNSKNLSQSDLKSSGASYSDNSDNEDHPIKPILDENLIRGSSCIRSCSANSAKRLLIYRRDWCGLICQIVIPLILVLFGLYLTSGPSKLV